jgi:protein-disulfide isomerase
MNTQKITLPAAIVVAGVLIAGAVLVVGMQKKNIVTTTAQDTTKQQETSITVDPITAKDHRIGDPTTAQITIVEYSDPECPFCKVFHQTMHAVVAHYGGKVAWVYRENPIVSLHPKAYHEAVAMECAASVGGEDAFWKYTDTLIANTPSNNRLDENQLPVFAQNIGLDMKKFNDCLSTGATNTIVDEGLRSGERAGATGTPYSIVLTKDGKQIIIPGAAGEEELKKNLDTLIK